MTDMEMIAVDQWAPVAPREGVDNAETYKNWDHDGHYETFRDFVAKHYSERVRIIRGDSADSAKFVEDGSLDFVFIDADHTYEGCLRDIHAWTPKVRSGGMVSGHDLHWKTVAQAVRDTGGGMALPDHVWVRFCP